MRPDGSRSTKSSIRRSATGSDSRWRCAARRFPTSRNATRASTCPIAGTICRDGRGSMFKALLARARQGYRTADYPARDPSLPALFRGRPVLDPEKCVDSCARCVDICPTDALRMSSAGPELDLGRCIFCGECASVCPGNAITFTQDWRLAASDRAGLVVTGDRPVQVEAASRELRRLLGRSLRLRQNSAGGCNGCEVEVNALGNVVFDTSRFG